MQELRPLAGYLKDLGTSVTAQEEVASTVWPGLQLTVHILDMGTADDEHLNACFAESFDALSSALGVGLAVRHHRAIPVKDERFIGFFREHGLAMKSSPTRRRHARRHPVTRPCALLAPTWCPTQSSSTRVPTGR